MTHKPTQLNPLDNPGGRNFLGNANGDRLTKEQVQDETRTPIRPWFASLLASSRGINLFSSSSSSHSATAHSFIKERKGSMSASASMTRVGLFSLALLAVFRLLGPASGSERDDLRFDMYKVNY